MDTRAGRYAGLTKRLLDAVLATSGQTASELRRAVLARAARLGGRRDSGEGDTRDGVPAHLAGYVDKVALHAYKVTDEDLAALKRGGNSDDVLFEATVSAALGAALGRLERGLRALEGEASSPPDPLSPTWRGGTQDER